MTALFVTIFGVTLVLFAILLHRTFIRTHQAEFDAALYNHAVDVAQGINVNLFGGLSVRPDMLYETEKIFPFSLGRAFMEIRSPDGKLLARSRSLGRDEMPISARDLESIRASEPVFRTIDSDLLPQGAAERTHSYRLLTTGITRGGLPPLMLRVAVPMNFLEKEERGLLTFFSFTIPLTLLAATLGGLFLSARAFKPVRAITTKAKAISATDLSARVPVPAPDDEVRSLALTINELLDRLQRTFENQERFIADASHQLKTPLSIMRGELDLMLSRPRPPEETTEFLKSASQEIDYLSRMVEDLLTLARMDAAQGTRMIPGMTEVRMDEATLEAISRLEPLARAKNVSIRFDLKGNEASPYTVQGDPELLQALLHNLIENAIKYSAKPGGEPTPVEVALADDVDSVVATVRDRGPGIPPEALSSIFERFYRVPSSPNKVAGAGLGLAIAHRIAEVHGGRIDVESRPGEGTAFTVRIKKV